MIPHDKIQKIVERLFERSVADEVNWLKSNRSRNEFQEYVVEFPESKISISYYSPSTDPDNIILELTDKRGVTVGYENVYEGSELWELYKGLYSEAERFVLGWDKILQDVEKAINSAQRVGIPSKTVTSRDR